LTPPAQFQILLSIVRRVQFRQDAMARHQRIRQMGFYQVGIMHFTNNRPFREWKRVQPIFAAA
jgi:hypothetical protein